MPLLPIEAGPWAADTVEGTAVKVDMEEEEEEEIEEPEPMCSSPF